MVWLGLMRFKEVKGRWPFMKAKKTNRQQLPSPDGSFGLPEGKGKNESEAKSASD